MTIETRDQYGNAIPAGQVDETKCPTHLLPLLQDLKAKLAKQEEIADAVVEAKKILGERIVAVAQARQAKAKEVGNRDFHSLWKTDVAGIEANNPEADAKRATHDEIISAAENAVADARALLQQLELDLRNATNAAQDAAHVWQTGQPNYSRQDLQRQVAAADMARKQQLIDAGCDPDYVRNGVAGRSRLDQRRAGEIGGNPASSRNGGRRAHPSAPMSSAYPASMQNHVIPKVPSEG
jgi:hypothetical protein